jgi:hypothetical protein
MPTILKPPGDQWASTEVTEVVTYARIRLLPVFARCRQTCHVDLGRRFCWRLCRSGLAAIQVAGEPVRAPGAACSRTQGLD